MASSLSVAARSCDGAEVTLASSMQHGSDAVKPSSTCSSAAWTRTTHTR